MTERRIGSDGLHVDVNAGQAIVGGDGLNVDVVPGPRETQTDAFGLTLDLTVPPLAVSAFNLQADLRVSAPTLTGYLGLMIDCIVSLVPTNAVRWSGLAFEMGTASPLAYWSGGAFQSSGASPVVWMADHFEASA